jgi:hypothetical protein
MIFLCNNSRVAEQPRKRILVNLLEAAEDDALIQGHEMELHSIL